MKFPQHRTSRVHYVPAPPTAAKRRKSIRARHHRLSIALFAIVLLVTALGIVLWGTDIALVRTIDIEGNEAVPREDIESVIREVMNSPLVGPLPGNLVFLPSDRLVSRLHETFPRIEAVRVTRNFGGKSVSVEVQERTAEGVYCYAYEETPGLEEEGEEEEEELVVAPEPQAQVELPPFTVGECYIIDRHGILFAEAPETEGSLILSFIDTEGEAASLGGTAISPVAFADVLALWNLFREEILVSVRRVVRRSQGLLIVETLEGWEAHFDLFGDVEAQMIALRELLAQELPPAERQGVSLIDLRVPGRIYYR